MGRLLGNDLKDQRYELEALLDVSNLLNGACLQGLGEQLHVKLVKLIRLSLGGKFQYESCSRTRINSGNKYSRLKLAIG